MCKFDMSTYGFDAPTHEHSGPLPLLQLLLKSVDRFHTRVFHGRTDVAPIYRIALNGFVTFCHHLPTRGSEEGERPEPTSAAGRRRDRA